jgi:hypothetical protein
MRCNKNLSLKISTSLEQNQLCLPCGSNDFLELSFEDPFPVGEEATLAAFAAIIDNN